jgi:hypothetical protein
LSTLPEGALLTTDAPEAGALKIGMPVDIFPYHSGGAVTTDNGRGTIQISFSFDGSDAYDPELEQAIMWDIFTAALIAAGVPEADAPGVLETLQSGLATAPESTYEDQNLGITFELSLGFTLDIRAS